MVKIGRILKDYREAGGLNALIALWGFVDDAAFLTKSGAVGLVFRMTGVDYEDYKKAFQTWFGVTPPIPSIGFPR